MPFIKPMLPVLLSIVYTNLLIAQKSELLACKNPYKPLIIVLYQDSMQVPLAEKSALHDAVKADKYNVFLLAINMTNSNAISVEINQLLNRNTSFDRQKIYLLAIGNDAVLLQYLQLSKSIFADTHYTKNNNIDLESILQQFDKKYLWNIHIDHIEEKNKVEVFQKKDYSVGWLLGCNWQNDIKKDSAYLPPFMMKYGFLVDYRFNNRIHLNGKVLFSVKIPNQKKIQNDIQEQINPSAGGTQSITAQINMRIITELSLQANHFFYVQKPLKPYLGLGVTVVNYLYGYKKITQSINTVSGGVGLNSKPDIPITSGTSLNPYLAFGFNYHLSKNANLIVCGDYIFQTKEKDYKGVTANYGLQNVSFQMGFMFKLASKTKYFYHYLN